MIDHPGELAALGAASCWVVSALSFESAGKRIGSLSLNLIRLTMACLPLALWGLITRGQLIPLDADAHTWTWLSASALVGFVLGDLCLFRAFVLIGPRLGMLIMASAPMWTALFGMVFLGESLAGRDLAGMGLILAGIGWAIAQKPTADKPEGDASINRQGVLLALGGALGQAGGLVLSKHGMADYDPFAATQIRVMVGVVGFAAVVTGLGWWGKIAVAIADRPAMQATAIGAVFGPFLGVACSLIAIQLAPTGIAATLMATTPILMLPVAWARGDRFGIGGVLGAVIAFAGVVLLLGACTTREPAPSEPDRSVSEPAERTQRVQLELGRVPDALAQPVIAELGLPATGLIAARHRIDPDWHIYWRNPGSAGLPTLLTSTPIAGSTLELGAPVLPAPDRFEDAYGWANEAILFVPILAGEGDLTIRSKWVACMADACVAGENEATLGASMAVDDPTLRAMLDRIPRPLGDRLLSSMWLKADDRVTLELSPRADLRTIEFFPDATDPALFFVEADYVGEDDTLTLVWRLGGSGYPPPTGQGVMAWTDDAGTHYYELGLPWPD